MNDRLGSLLVAVIGNVVGGMFLGSAAGILFCHWKLPPLLPEAMTENWPRTRRYCWITIALAAALLTLDERGLL